MPNVFDIVLAVCLIAVLSNFCKHLWLPWLQTTFTGSMAEFPPGQQGHDEDMAAAKVLRSMDFEIFGKVQGVFFRKNTRETAKKYGLVGWVKNTRTSTVVGVAQGPQEKINLMKSWLRTKGSKHSIIDRAEFKNERTVDKLEFEEFKIDLEKERK